MNIDTAFPSKYLKVADCEAADLVLTIKDVKVENVAGSNDDKDVKPAIYFVETEQGLVLNKTNANTIKGLYTSMTEQWAGKRIALFAFQTEFAGKPVMGIRVRLQAPDAGAESTAPPVAPPADTVVPF